MKLIDVTGGGNHLINLTLVRCIRTKDSGGKVEVRFVYGNGDEDTFWVSSERLAVLYDTLVDYEVTVA